MKYFNEINLPKYDTLFLELSELLNSNKLNWGDQNQICLNSITGFENDFHKGTGSLGKDHKFAFAYASDSPDGVTLGVDNVEIIKKENRLFETDFNVLCNVFKGTTFENIYSMLSNHYLLGRVRIMKLDIKNCLSWHVDMTPRLHYPIITQEGCFLVIEDEVVHIPAGKWYMADTTKKHTAFNSSNKSRIHLVATILETK
jgi:hypothetical protein